MAEQPLNQSLEDNQSAAKSNIEVGKIEVGGNVGGSIIIGQGNTINLPPEQAVFRSLHQLPQPPADFTGREELIEQLIADFEHGKGTTIAGLTGMGGIGKTALGLVVASQVAKKYPDAQIFLDLKGATTPLSAIDAMRHVILSFEPKMDLRALDETGMTSAYLSVLHRRQVLLFLDNVRSAQQIASLRPPETCAMLVTSRWTFSVPGLQPHRLDLMSEEKAKDFLLQLCPRIKEHALVLARACGYLPLALRITGSFLAVNEHWRVEEYLAQLHDRKRRLATLKESREEAELATEPDVLAAFEMSYQQLSEDDPKRWRVLGVFPTSFDADAAGAMWELEVNETRKLLGLLLRYSLLDYNENTSRYSLHDLLADYALSQMDAEEEHEARLKHASHYKNVLLAANLLYREGGEKILTGLHLFDLEWKNIRMGQMWVSQNADDKDQLELCNDYLNAGYLILPLRLHPRERIAWLIKGLDAARKIGNKEDEGYHLGSLGVAYYSLGETRKAIEFYEGHLAIAREIGDRRGEGHTLGSLGIAYADLGENRKAIEFYEQCLAIMREIGNRRIEGTMLGSLGIAYADLGENRKAIEFYEGQLAIARETGDRRGEGNALGNLGTAYKDLGDAHKASEFHEQDLAIARELGDRRGEGKALGSLGIAYADLGETRKAVEFHEQELAIAREIGHRRGEGKALFNMGLALYELEEKDRAINLMKQALEIFEAIESPYAERARKKLQEWGALP